jgi:uncharacterized delta-60 repeat protein
MMLVLLKILKCARRLQAVRQRKTITNAFSLILAWMFVATASAAPGDFDTTFGSGVGRVISAIGNGFSTGTALTLQPDRKILLAGFCEAGTTTATCVVRYNANGSRDESFGDMGVVITPLGTRDSTNAIALQPDGKIIVAGSCIVTSNINRFCLARFQSNGVLDDSFGTLGKTNTEITAENNYLFAIALQVDGKIVAVGTCGLGSDARFCIARYNANGTLDTGFRSDGAFPLPIGGNGDDARAVALQPDGKIVVAGFCRDTSVNENFCLARFNTNGNNDLAFSSDGRLTTEIGTGNDRASAVAIQPDGRILVAGQCDGATTLDFCLARYNANGTLDTEFSNDGKLISPIGTSDDYVRAVAVQPDGKIVVAGFCLVNATSDFCIARYAQHGVIDSSFNGNGKVITNVGSGSDDANDMLIQPDGKIVAGGSCFSNGERKFCLARYEGGPFGYKNCTMDIDGDGKVTATVDSLIHARIALGMTGSAVTGGITFPANATRNSWSEIRTYLVTQCGMTIAP